MFICPSLWQLTLLICSCVRLLQKTSAHGLSTYYQPTRHLHHHHHRPNRHRRMTAQTISKQLSATPPRTDTSLRRPGSAVLSASQTTTMTTTSLSARYKVTGLNTDHNIDDYGRSIDEAVQPSSAHRLNQLVSFVKHLMIQVILRCCVSLSCYTHALVIAFMRTHKNEWSL